MLRAGHSLQLILGAFALCSSSCTRPVFHNNSDYEYPPRAADCYLRVVGSHPGPAYDEIGIVTFDGTNPFQDEQEFIDPVRAELCAAGADVIFTQVSADGVVVRGVVLVNIYEDPDGDASEEAAPVPAAVADCSPICSPGFKCSAGRCVPPAAGECTPICSPGFGCSGGVCIPLCNPACASTEECGTDRLCHPRVEPAPPPPAANSG